MPKIVDGGIKVAKALCHESVGDRGSPEPEVASPVPHGVDQAEKRHSDEQELTPQECRFVPKNLQRAVDAGGGGEGAGKGGV